MKPATWTEHFRVNSHDTDFRGEVRPSAVLRYLQETSNLEHFHCGPTLDELQKAGKIFLLSKVSLRLLMPLRSFDEIDAESWFAGVHGFSFLRCGRIMRGGETAALMSSVWAMVDPDTRKLIRAGEDDFGFGVSEPIDLGFPPRLYIPKELSLTDAGTRKIVYADCDFNRHMNNTNYPDMFYGCLPGVPDRVSEYEVAYLNEAPMGETMQPFFGQEDGNTYFRSLRPDGKINAEARMRFVSGQPEKAE